MVKGYFSAFHRGLYVIPRYFDGVVQQRVKKDEYKNSEGRRLLVKDKMLPYDEKLCSERTDAANKCAMIYSNIVTDIFLSTNIEAQNYFFNRLFEITNTQQKKWLLRPVIWRANHLRTPMFPLFTYCRENIWNAVT